MGTRQDAPAFDALAQDVARLGVEEACRLHRIHRSTWYRRSKRQACRNENHGMDKAMVADEIRRIALEHPVWGCDRIAYYLSFSGFLTSSPSVQKILIQAGLGRRAQREQAALAQDAPGTLLAE